MSGHNKWSQIKNKKAKTDGVKSKLYSKYSKLISAEARVVKGDRNSPSLRAIIERARAEDVTSEVIERALKKGSEPGAAMESIIYEAYGPGGCALLIEAFTSNKNKAAQEVKHILSEQGLALAAPGSASWAFVREGAGWKATMTVDLTDDDLTALGAIVDALEASEEVQEIYTNVE